MKKFLSSMVSTITLVVLTVIITHTATFAQQKASNWSAMGKPKKVFHRKTNRSSMA
jgi:hypothetical protein